MFWLPLAQGAGRGWGLSGPSWPVPRVGPASYTLIRASLPNSCHLKVTLPWGHPRAFLPLPGGRGVAVIWGLLPGPRLSWDGRDTGSGNSENDRAES